MQELIDRYYTPAYEAIWRDFADDWTPEQLEAALERTERAWEKAVARIKRETGYTV